MAFWIKFFTIKTNMIILNYVFIRIISLFMKMLNIHHTLQSITKDIKDIKDHQNIIKMKKGKYEKSSNKKYKCKSIQLIKNLFEGGNFDTDNCIITYTDQYQKLNDKEIPLSNIEEEQELYEYKEKKEKESIIFFADTETDTTAAHSGLLTGVIKMKEKNTVDDVRIFMRGGRECKKWITGFLELYS